MNKVGEMLELDKVALAVVTAAAIGAPPVYVQYVSEGKARSEADKVEQRLQKDLDQKFELLRSDINGIKEDTRQVREVLMKGRSNV